WSAPRGRETEQRRLTEMLRSARVRLTLDCMGGDLGPAAVIEGAKLAQTSGLDLDFLLFGDKATLEPLVAQFGLERSEIRHAEGVVAMTDKPAQVLRRGRDTSMWSAIGAVGDGSARAVVSCGNTGALMALSWKQLTMIDGVARPAITALWPTPRGRTVVLDVGANVEATDVELVHFAIMGEAFFRALTGVAKPSVGLLNVGAEELKGHETIRSAARILREADPEMGFQGFVEGDDISKGAVDVVVTDGFTGNVALKTAEGAARLVGVWLKETLTASIFTRIGALILRPALLRLKARMDPSSVNGGVFLGLNGIVVKSHGGADALGVKSAIEMAANLAERPFIDDIRQRIAKVGATAAAVKSDVKAAAV
ncbi:MAG: phosphate acyltransferase PlsX, partial [Parvularculaceae bacterium]|nr:phosphate acyltransferase PlsX [Parvularculaceae bacterium]